MAPPGRLKLRDLTQPLPAFLCSICTTADRAGGERLGEVSQIKTTGSLLRGYTVYSLDAVVKNTLKFQGQRKV